MILGAGKAIYQFKLVKKSRILPSPSLMSIKIADATPEIISKYALGDEQALLAKVRYNRLVDIFFGDESNVLVPATSVTKEDLKNYSLLAMSECGTVPVT